MSSAACCTAPLPHAPAGGPPGLPPRLLPALKAAASHRRAPGCRLTLPHTHAPPPTHSPTRPTPTHLTGFFRLWTDSDPYGSAYTKVGPLLEDFKNHWNTQMTVSGG